MSYRADPTMMGPVYRSHEGHLVVTAPDDIIVKAYTQEAIEVGRQHTWLR